jgi:hypothetical protein
MSLIDRILNGDFDDKDDVSIPAIKTHNHRGSKGTCSPARSADPNEDEELVTDEEEEFEDLPSEDIDDKDSTVIMEESSDIPSEEWMKEYMEENDLDVSEPEPVPTAPTQYVEKPKQSKVREIKKTMNNETNETPAQTTPKQSATKSADAGTKKRGAPHKLTEHADEVCRLYNEGVGAKTIAEKFSVSVSCVINTLKRSNVTIRPKGRRKTSD